MTHLCVPLRCDQIATCLRYADERRVEQSAEQIFADFSLTALLGRCPWYLSANVADEEHPQ